MNVFASYFLSTSFLTDINSILYFILGTTVSVTTLICSFALNKRDQYLALGKRKESLKGDVPPELDQTIQFAKRRTAHYFKSIKLALSLIGVLIVLTSANWFFTEFHTSAVVKLILIILSTVVVGLSIALYIYFITQFFHHIHH